MPAGMRLTRTGIRTAVGVGGLPGAPATLGRERAKCDRAAPLPVKAEHVEADGHRRRRERARPERYITRDHGHVRRLGGGGKKERDAQDEERLLQMLTPVIEPCRRPASPSSQKTLSEYNPYE
jgi:hypothetical protein